MKHEIIKQKLLKIYIDNTDEYNGEALWSYILNSAKEHKLSGATVYKAVAGVGSNLEIHTFDIFNLSVKMPIIIEIVDLEEKIIKFLNSLDTVLKEAFVTMYDVDTIKYKPM